MFETSSIGNVIYLIWNPTYTKNKKENYWILLKTKEYDYSKTKVKLN